MSDSDARLCFERHATSKIHKADDLFAIRTMGFRGEALASIAAIAQVELKTKMHGNELGTEVCIEGCHVSSQNPCSCPDGTSISVKNLFFNVPARRNFLKKDSIELGHIEEVFRRIVLIHNEIGFTFHSNGKLLYDLKSDGMLQRVCQVFGEAYKERFYPVEEASNVVSVKGYVSKAEYAKRNREQYLFVNGRFIKHPMLNAAIEKAYEDLIPEGSHPSYFISLTVDPSRMDVNIHPTKTEVRFMDENAMFSLLRAVVRKSLGQFSLASELEFNPSTELSFVEQPKNYVPKAPTINYNPNYNPFSESRGTSSSNRQQWESFFESLPEVSRQEDEKVEKSQWRDVTDDDQVFFQIQDRYIACPTKEGLLIVDQKLAHERILYERLAERERPIVGQQILFPVNCSFSAADAELITELLPELLHSGFEMERMAGSNVYVVTATPADLNDNELQNFFDTIIVEYKSAMLEKFGDRNKKLYMSIARRMAVKAVKPLLTEEMRQLVNDLMQCSMPAVSPSGERITTLLTTEKIRQLFQS